VAHIHTILAEKWRCEEVVSQARWVPGECSAPGGADGFRRLCGVFVLPPLTSGAAEADIVLLSLTSEDAAVLTTMKRRFRGACRSGADRWWAEFLPATNSLALGLSLLPPALCRTALQRTVLQEERAELH